MTENVYLGGKIVIEFSKKGSKKIEGKMTIEDHGDGDYQFHYKNDAPFGYSMFLGKETQNPLEYALRMKEVLSQKIAEVVRRHE